MLKIFLSVLVACFCIPILVQAGSVFSNTRQPYSNSGLKPAAPQRVKPKPPGMKPHPVDPDYGVRPPHKPGRPGKPGWPGKPERPIYIVPGYYYGGAYEPRQEPAAEPVQPAPQQQIIIVPPLPRTFKKCEEGPDSTDPDCMDKPKSSRQLRWEQFMRRHGG